MVRMLRIEKQPARIALVIGNSEYDAVAPLPNAARDAVLIGDELTGLGVEVHGYEDLDKVNMNVAIEAFCNRLHEIGQVDTVVFFFSGHGYQDDGVNYLLPIDGTGETNDSIALQGIVDKLSAKSRRRLIFLDACRNSLDTQQVHDTVMRTRSIAAGQHLDIKRGLADFDVADDTFISFSAAPGKPAYDGVGDRLNSPYAEALARFLSEVDLPLSVMMTRVRNSVLHDTKKEQKTWDNSSLRTSFFFSPSSLLFLLGNTLALIAALIALISSGVVLYETAIAEFLRGDAQWGWVITSLAILTIAVAIFLYGVGRAYSRVRGEQSDWQTEGDFELFRWSSAGTFGALGGILGGILVPALVIVPYWRDWRMTTNDDDIVSARCIERNLFDPFMPSVCPKIGQLFAEGGVSGIFIMVLVGFFCLHFSEWMTRGRPATFFHDIRRSRLLICGAMIGGLVAGIVVGPLVTVYFGAQDRPFLQPQLLIVPSILAVALTAFCVVNYRLETFTAARVGRSFLGALLGTLCGAAVLGAVVGVLYITGFIDGVLIWAADVYYDNYDLGYAAWQRYGALMLAGLPYGMVFGLGFGVLIAVTRLITEREPKDADDANSA